MSTQMESYASVLGALSAGKMPTQSQVNSWIDCVVRQIDALSNTSQDPSLGRLSDHGQRLSSDLKQVLLAYKELGTNKNGDDVLQTGLYDLSRGELRTDPSLQKSQKEALSDADKASNAFREVVTVFIQHLTSTKGGLADFASFVRTFIADTAEVVEQHAGTVKSDLRQTEQEVQEGKRDPLGRSVPEEGQPTDTRERFERGMDTAKAAGSNIIGGSQAVKQSGDQLANKVSQDLDQFIENLLINAENDENYKRAILTVFDLASKWINKSVESVDNNSLNDVINDPTGRISNALGCFNTLLERLADKSTNDLLNALRTTARDVREDPELKKFFDDTHNFMRRSLAEPTYVRSDEHTRNREELSQRWKQLQSGEQHRKWHDDMDRLCNEYQDFFARIENDSDVKRLHEASLVFGEDVTQAALTLREAALGNANWLWQDVTDVYIPRALDHLKEVPVPRIEYKDSDVEFVIEDLLLDTLKLLPGRARIHNATDLDVSKPSVNQDAKTSVKSYTNIYFKGVQLKARDVSFWYNDTTMQPVSEISGLLGVTIPKEGVDVEIALTLLPQPDKKDAHKARQHAFFKVERVNVQLNKPEFTIRKSNHSFLFTMFKPMVQSRIEKAIETTMQRQIAMSVEFIDNVLFEIYSRANVFADTGMPWSASYLSAIWSEIGHLKQQPGLFTGLHTTSVGIIKDDPRQDASVAIGAQPQIISGDKHGPIAPGSNSHAKRDQAVRLAEESKNQAGMATNRAESGVASFAQEVQFKKDRELHREGWQSNAFDVHVMSH